jgi:hypothetical protein
MHLLCVCKSNESVVMPDDSFHYEVVTQCQCFSWHWISVILLYPSLTEMCMDRSVEVIVTDGVE